MHHPPELRVVAYLSPRIPRAFSRQSSSMCSVHVDPDTGDPSAESASHHHDQPIYGPCRGKLNSSVTYSRCPIGYIWPADTFVPFVKLYRHYRKET